MTAQGDGSVAIHANPGSTCVVGPGFFLSIILFEILRGSARGQRPHAMRGAGGGATVHLAACSFG